LNVAYGNPCKCLTYTNNPPTPSQPSSP
jgi:hypothetical protein